MTDDMREALPCTCGLDIDANCPYCQNEARFRKWISDAYTEADNSNGKLPNYRECWQAAIASNPKVSEDIGNLLGHMASVVGSLVGWDKENTATFDSAQHVLDTLRKMYEPSKPQVAFSIRDRDHAERQLAKIAAENMRLREAEAKYLPVIEGLVDEAVDARLLNDAITLITKSLAGMLTDTSFASPYAEDHRATTPRWVIAKFAHDYDRRVQYVNDIKQRLDWVRNATEKARKGKALDLAAPLLGRE